MKNLATIFLFVISISLFAQTNKSIVSEYVSAENYGGKPELKRFLKQEMNYPVEAYKKKIQGTVELVFAVNSKTGETSQLKIQRSVEKSIDAEAIRLYKMLLFKPSSHRNSNLVTFCSLKIKFNTKTYTKYCKKRGYKTIDLENPLFDYSNTIYGNKKVKVSARNVFEDSLMTLNHFIYQHLKYPEGTLRLNIKGLVKFNFIVEPSGRITNINAIKVLGGGATKEAERILKLLKWTPAQKDGKYVRTIKTFEVNFNLSNESEFNDVPTGSKI